MKLRNRTFIHKKYLEDRSIKHNLCQRRKNRDYTTHEEMIEETVPRNSIDVGNW
jgi:hypothetical protein